jgi:2-dehydro-3-deoxyphosphogluconate aldolase/(4S)-4-hydroxy-2-oxoglutarate aldolase
MSEFSLYDALKQRILPAISFDKEEHVLPVAEALLKGGLRAIEITFRSSVTEKAIGLIRKNFDELCVGAGTILSTDQIGKAMNAGAQFGLSPGFNPSTCRYAKQMGFPFIPGVMTPSEIEVTNEMGYKILKLFPIEQIGGTGFLKAMQGPFDPWNIQFIPMGGVNSKNMNDYLQLKNVIAVGGSWIATKELMQEKRYNVIAENARKALGVNGEF